MDNDSVFENSIKSISEIINSSVKNLPQIDYSNITTVQTLFSEINDLNNDISIILFYLNIYNTYKYGTEDLKLKFSKEQLSLCYKYFENLNSKFTQSNTNNIQNILTALFAKKYQIYNKSFDKQSSNNPLYLKRTSSTNFEQLNSDFLLPVDGIDSNDLNEKSDSDDFTSENETKIKEDEEQKIKEEEERKRKELEKEKRKHEKELEKEKKKKEKEEERKKKERTRN